ncbi:MAG: hypothetical protein KGH61_04630 [Candidatus Micrarchaeota archaeon]|nr:hypothetical protein [Candidatus Micrarchaeota archaeon]MDE1848203.1 hypothetical protein [Candidatus Micrarchaeota archaeon]MDE1864851.1 hypothetical protein [Candidatus Micrarchaeota archaeon]
MLDRKISTVESASGVKSVLLGQEKRDANPRSLANKFKILQRGIITSPEFISKLERIWAYDLTSVTEKLISKGAPIWGKSEQLHMLEGLLGKDVSRELAVRLEVEFKRYMSMIALDQVVGMGPSRMLDMYWHQFMLDTREYSKFCFEVLGRFIDHVPSTSKTLESALASYARSLETYRQMFGEPDPTMWPSPGKTAGECTTKCEGKYPGAGDPGCEHV